MQLHELLRKISTGISILIFDLEGNNIAKVSTKENLSVDLYEYLIYEISIGPHDAYRTRYSLYITIEK